MLLLPPEIVGFIFSYLDPEEDRSTILALRTICKQFDSLAQPLVSVTIRDHTVGEIRPTTWDVISEPSLARIVKCLQLRPFNDAHALTCEVKQAGKYSQAKSVEEVYRRNLSATALPPAVQERVLNELVENSHRAHVLLMLAMCPRLKIIDISAGCNDHRSLRDVFAFAIQSFRARPLNNNHPSQSNVDLCASLTHVTIGNASTTSSVADALILLQLPCLESLHIKNLIDGFPYRFCDRIVSSALPGGKTCISSRPLDFVFDLCGLSARGLGLILSVCSGPCSVAVRWRASYNDLMTEENIGAVVREHGDNLVSLTLDTTELERPGGMVSRRDWFGEINTMMSLRRLALPAKAFWGTLREHYWDFSEITDRHRRYRLRVKEMLPSSIQELFFLGVNRDSIYAPYYEDLVTAIELPCLRRVVLVPWTKEDRQNGNRSRGYPADLDESCVDYGYLTESGEEQLAFLNPITVELEQEG